MKSLLAALTLWAVAMPCPAATAESGAIAIDVTIEPDSFHEECLTLEAGEKRRYHWNAEAPVDFNVHYHRGDEVFYPVKREGKRSGGGTFTAKSAEGYCWMWSAKTATRLDGRIENRGQSPK